jgi:DNA-binding response OmpR family regulator
VLLVESEGSLRRVITVSLKELGLRVLDAPDIFCAKDLLKTERPDLLITELDFPFGRNGELIELYRMQNGECRGAVLVTTTQRFGDDWRRKYRPDVTLFKPFDIRVLCKFVSALLGGDHDEGEHSLIRNRIKK